MLSIINMRVFKALLIAALLYDTAECSPAKPKPHTKGPTTTKAPIESANGLQAWTSQSGIAVQESSTQSISGMQTSISQSASAVETSNSQSVEAGLLRVPQSNMTIDYYDQRQNGSENFRVHVDGFAFVLAPVETLLVGQAIGDDALATTTEHPIAEHKPTIMSKSNNRGGLNVANLLVPFLRRFRQS